ncbi:hypothetical protein [Caballeronia humi]|uniref:Uncharacterized protein n=1 Tax=Caballeronia humi TaxID=326474 RepID=A0A158I6B0_9BURK|nr:hypothetical protein [Caballeronia humi]SAL51779.1 hypothetical protein AWB65_04256 [Caballeronia humi]
MPQAPTDSIPTDQPTSAISANAAKVLDTTRRAWQTSAAAAPVESERATQKASSKKRVRPRRSQWGNLVAALNYWSPRPL